MRMCGCGCTCRHGGHVCEPVHVHTCVYMSVHVWAPTEQAIGFSSQYYTSEEKNYQTIPQCIFSLQPLF